MFFRNPQFNEQPISVVTDRIAHTPQPYKPDALLEHLGELFQEIEDIDKRRKLEFNVVHYVWQMKEKVCITKFSNV